MADSPTAIADFSRVKERIVGGFDGLIECARRAEATDDADRLTRGRDALADDRFRVVVLGQWKTGKTTLINALLGAAGFLPTRIVEATGNVNVIRYGPNPRAVVHFSPAAPGGEPPAPREVPVSGLADFVLIKSLKKSGLLDRIERVEVFYPLPLCGNGVELVDTPGLNAGEARDEATLSFIPQADAVILVMKAPAAFGEAERKLLQYHVSRAHVGKVFFVVNGRNLLRGADQIAELMDDLKDRIRRCSGMAEEPRVYLLDALAAEEASAGRSAAVEPHFAEFRADLERFLTGQKTELTVKAALSRAVGGAAMLSARIAAHRRALENEAETLRARYEAIKPRFAALHEKKDGILEAVRAAESRLSEALVESLTAECRRLAGPPIPEHLGAWLRGDPTPAPALPGPSGKADDDAEATAAAPPPDPTAVETAADIQDFLRRIPLSAADTGITLMDRLIPGSAATKAREYILARLGEYLRIAIRKWADSGAQPILRREVDALTARTGPRARDIFDELHRMQLEFSAPAGHDDKLSDGERIGVALLGGLGLLAANPTALLGGALGGIAGAVRQLSLTVAAGLALLLLHVHNPLAWPALIVANVVFALLWEGEQKTRRLRFALAKGCREQLLGEVAGRPSGQIRRMTADTFARCRADVQSELDAAIRGMQAEMEKVLAEASQAAEVVAAKREQLEAVRLRVEEIGRELAGAAL